MKLYPSLIFFIGVIGLILSACSLPDNHQPANNAHLIFTAAAQTLEAQLTQEAVPEAAASSATSIAPTSSPVASPTPPLETETPGQTSPTSAAIPTQPCDAARFLADITIPDGTKLSGGESFTKTWKFKNIGSCTWDSSYTLIFDVGDLMGGPASLPLTGTTASGQEVNISVTLQAPSTPGKYRGYWRLRNPSGVMLPIANGYNSKSFYVDIQVKNTGNSAKFSVTDVAFNVSHSGTCSSGTYTVTAKLTTNGAGEVSYMWKRSDGISDLLSNGALTFSSAGNQIISYDWVSGATGLSITLYIDNPNHHEFGTALLNCL